MLAYALDRAQDDLFQSGGFSDEDQAALTSLQGRFTHTPTPGSPEGGCPSRVSLLRDAAEPAPGPLPPLAVHAAAAAIARDTARTVARLIADTLTAMLPTAAYLVLDENHYEIALHSVLDASGATLRTFTTRPEAPLPPLDPASALRSAWQGEDPGDPQTIASVLLYLLNDGMVLDIVPDDLPDRDAPLDYPCLLLSPDARPGSMSDLDDELHRLLRLYGPAERPVHSHESPLSSVLTHLSPDDILSILRHAVDPHNGADGTEPPTRALDVAHRYLTRNTESHR
ncbi:hypothetical protein [Streptacidiphilus sp. EB103A]|uniref:hypothetical protein n=1 Tax=Streptacidiphilus sp. EB103A TaxID=3156275 RepID=UPI003517115F